MLIFPWDGSNKSRPDMSSYQSALMLSSSNKPCSLITRTTVDDFRENGVMDREGGNIMAVICIGI